MNRNTTEAHRIASLSARLPGCCTRSRSRRAGEPCTGPPARGRRCSDSGTEAFSWLWVPHRKATKRLWFGRGARGVGCASRMLPAEMRKERCRVIWPGERSPFSLLSPPSLLSSLPPSLYQFNPISDISAASPGSSVYSVFISQRELQLLLVLQQNHNKLQWDRAFKVLICLFFTVVQQ